MKGKHSVDTKSVSTTLRDVGLVKVSHVEIQNIQYHDYQYVLNTAIRCRATPVRQCRWHFEVQGLVGTVWHLPKSH